MAKTEKTKIYLLLLMWLVAFIPVFPAMVRDWFSHPDNSHAFLVPFVALYFFWQKKDELQTARPGSSAWGGALFAVSLLTYVLSYAGGATFPARVAMVSSLFGLVWFCLGNDFIRIAAFPLCFLIFMVPVPYSVTSIVSMPLQIMATRIADALIGNCSIPVYREGNMLYFMETQLEVAEACSGIRSIMSLMMLGFIFGYLSRGNLWVKVLLVAASIPIAVFANIVRVTGTGILAHFYGAKVARGFLHEFSGLVIFIFGLALLFALFHLTNRKKANDVQ
jgi:exosortase